MNPALLLLAGLCFGTLGLAIIAHQRRAAQCSRHDPRVGALAMVLAAGSLIAAAVLLWSAAVGWLA
ncbi:MAG: hypothetical protein H6945_14565 [Zoogloeaceae bacterium]|nr:hypothetical protein [Rhodocyclaceae bacterium]MCP5236955.1 hypothetical protein [Zoogloeaceae bacterium]